jgi:hypothetical protein
MMMSLPIVKGCRLNIPAGFASTQKKSWEIFSVPPALAPLLYPGIREFWNSRSHDLELAGLGFNDHGVIFFGTYIYRGAGQIPGNIAKTLRRDGNRRSPAYGKNCT